MDIFDTIKIGFFVFWGFLFSSVQAQTTLSGTVKDTLGVPLANANVLAFPKSEASPTYAIADTEGKYRLRLERNTAYEIQVSYIGYQSQKYVFNPENPVAEHHFVMKPQAEELEGVLVEYELPVVVKGDSTIFKVEAFTSGNERKLKDQLEKLPGVEVSKNGKITFQGKPVSKLMVEGKDFFGGGTKLAVENLPADAVDKVEFVDNYNEVSFLQGLSDSDRLAINIKLKEGKKKFVFGDVEAGYGNRNFHLAHAGLFYYTPNLALSYIGDMNNIGERTFSHDDLMRFEGGVSSFLSRRKRLFSLYDLAKEDVRLTKNNSLLNALNINYQLTPKTLLSGYVIHAKTRRDALSDLLVSYLQTNASEHRITASENRQQLALANLKLDYTPKVTGKWYYNLYADVSDNQNLKNITSQRTQETALFHNEAEIDNANIRQYLEWHKQHSRKITTTFVLNHSLEKATPQTHWFTNRPFLPGLIPLQPDTEYRLQQLKKSLTNNIDLLLKKYWTVSNNHHIYTSVGNNLTNSLLVTSEKQPLTSGAEFDFSGNGFGNDADYLLNDFFVGIDYKFRIGTLIHTPSVSLHNYYLSVNQNNVQTSRIKWRVEPQWRSEWEIAKSKKLLFTYAFTNTFPNIIHLADRYTLEAYNAVYKGNALLREERFHNATLRYTHFDFFRGANTVFSANFRRKNSAIQNEVVLQDINYVTIPANMETPQTYWNVHGYVTRRIYRFSLSLHSTLSGFEYGQNINGIEAYNIRNSQEVGTLFRITYRKWPDVRIGYTHRFNQLKGISKNAFQTQKVTADFDHEIIKRLTLKTDFSWNNILQHNTKNEFYLWNASLFFQKEKSPFGFEFRANNLLNTRHVYHTSFSDFMISEQTTQLLPRVFLATVHYKL
ncbi:MAG: carboxypeptidase-like regulatory domain-containing protein [Capnocytophaga sp.]|nr:carboxypeptidase-like regulatory domain-containing protein [Capnocytophaga sp.]